MSELVNAIKDIKSRLKELDSKPNFTTNNYERIELNSRLRELKVHLMLSD